MTVRFLLVLCVLGALARAMAQPGPDSLLVKASKLMVAPDTILDNGLLLVRDGKVIAVGTNIPLETRSGARLIELDGWVTPGFVNPHTHLSLGSDLAERVAPATPELRATDAFDPFDPLLALAANFGVTTLGLAPTSLNPIAGIAGVVKSGNPGLVAADTSYLKIALVAEALDGERPPTSRMGAAALVRQELALARMAAAASDAKLAALRDLVAGTLRPAVHARTPAEIAAALDLYDQLGAPPLLIGGDGIRSSLPRVKAKQGSVILAPLALDSRREALTLPAALEAAGVAFSFMADQPPRIAAPPPPAVAPGTPPPVPTGKAGGSGPSNLPIPGHPEALRWSAALAVGHGTSRTAAFAALTRTPAGQLGVEARAGTLREGLDADFVHWSGDPLDLTSRLVAVYMAGQRFAPANPTETVR